MANIKCKKLLRQVTHNGGITWETLTPTVYKIGDIIEEDSNCFGEYTKRMEWREYPVTKYMCDGYNKYSIYYQVISNDGKMWFVTGVEKKGRLLEENSMDCGYIPPTE